MLVCVQVARELIVRFVKVDRVGLALLCFKNKMAGQQVVQS